MSWGRRRVVALVVLSSLLVLAMAAVGSAKEGSAKGGEDGAASSSRPDFDGSINDPRSGAAINRDAALNPAPAPPSVFGEEDQRRINALPVNDPAADATAQDTQSETTVNAMGSNVVAGWNDSGSCIPCPGSTHFTGHGRSTNFGNSFTDGGTLPTSTEGDAGDPVLARHDATNSLYLATLGFTTGENLQVFKSTNGGSTWSAPVNGTPGYGGTGDFQDKEWMAVDNSGGANDSNVYLCWTRFLAGGGAQVRMTRSTNDGASFGNDVLISTGGQGCYVAVGPSGEVYVFYYRGTGGGGQGGDNKLWVRKSTDGGLTFGTEVQVADLNTTTVNGGLGLNGGLRSNSFPHAAINPVSGHLIVTYNDDPNVADESDDGDIFFVRSTNGGATWSAPVKVNEDGPGDQFFPTVAISPSGLRIMFGYYSRSHDPANLMFHRRGRLGNMNTSLGGTALRPSFQLGPDTPVVIGQDPVINPTYMGDYDQIDPHGVLFHSVWSDNRDGNSFHAFQPDVRYASIDARGSITNADLNVNVSASPSTIDEGDQTTITVGVTAQGSAARDVYLSLAPPTGMTFDSASGSCELVNGFVGCRLFNFTAGQTKSRTIVATGAEAGAKTVTANATTPDFETDKPDNTDSATVTVNAIPSTTQTFSTGNIAVPVPPSPATVPLTIGTAGTILDVDALVRMNHTWTGDIDMFLESPTGTIVELSTDNHEGGGDNFGSGANDCGGTPTTFDDEATTAITAALPPFAGSFKPEGLLSDFDGEVQNGTWELHLTDDFLAADGGTVGCFSLRIRRPT